MFNSIFDKLKEAKYFNKNNRFQEFYNVKYFKEIKRLSLQVKAEAYLEPKRASTMELFVNILNGLLFLQQKLHHKCSSGLYICLLKY